MATQRFFYSVSAYFHFGVAYLNTVRYYLSCQDYFRDAGVTLEQDCLSDSSNLPYI